MHDGSMSSTAERLPARAAVPIGALVSLMIGCQPAFAEQSSQTAPAIAVSNDLSRTAAPNTAGATRVGFVDGLRHPESVLYDSIRAVFYVSNRDGASGAKDGTGFIAKLRADGTLEDRRWIEGGKNGVTLNAPKGMAIIGDVLWIADIDVMRAFDAQTGSPITEVRLASLGARALKDVMVGPDRSVYVTSGALPTDDEMTARDRILRIDLSGRATTVLQFAHLRQPNGIIWDRFNNRFLIAPRSSDSIWTWRPGAGAFGVHELDDKPLAGLLEDAGDVASIEWDAKRQLLYVPLSAQNRVDIFRLVKR